MYNLQEIKDKISVPQFLQHRGIQVANGGRCVSPLRPEAQNPTSFWVTDNFWYDFGTATGGDVIDLAALLQFNGDVGKAIRYLADIVGLPREDNPSNTWKDDIQRLCNRTAAYQESLTAEDYDYLAKRGFKREDVERLRIGRVRDGYLKGRLFLPYFKNGAAVYYATRAMPGSTYPENKYMKASRSECESYQNVPWGLQTLDRRSSTLIISEGYFDAASWESAGYPVLSPITGNFSKEQWPIVISACKLFERVFIIFDNDAVSHAGDNFAKRTADKLFQNHIKFLVGHTPKNIKDVNDYYASGGSLQELIDDATPGMQYMASACKNANELLEFIQSIKRYTKKIEIVELMESLNYPASVKREILKEAVKPPEERTIAEEIIKQYNLIYLDQVGIYSFDGRIWAKLPDEVVRGYAADAYQHFATAQRVASVCKLVKSLSLKNVEMNKKPVFTFQNGTLEIETGTFRSFSENDYCSIIMDYDYDPNAQCPKWERFVNDITDDEPRREDVLQTMTGYILTPDCRFQKIFVLLGGGSNGKSVFLEIIQKLFGDQNVSVVMPFGLTQEFQRVKLKDSLVNIGKDVSPDFATGDIREWLLNVSDGTMIQACYKGQTHIEIIPRCKLIYSMNKPPYSSVVEGLGRRLQFVEFPCSFVDFPDANNPKEKERDTNLIPKLLKELPGIFNWAYAGYRMLMKAGYFMDTPEQEELAESFKESSDPLQTFCKDRVFSGRMTRAELYLWYKSWCEETGHRCSTRTKFIRDFRSHMKDQIVDEYESNVSGTRDRGFVFKGNV